MPLPTPHVWTDATLIGRYGKIAATARANQDTLMSAYRDHKPEVAIQKRNELRERYMQDTASELESLLRDTEAALTTTHREIRERLYPDLTSHDIQRRTFATLEQLNVYFTADVFSESILRDALADGRRDFAQSYYERAASTPIPPDGPYLNAEMAKRERFFSVAKTLLADEQTDRLRERERNLATVRDQAADLLKRTRDGYDVGEISRALREAYPPGQHQLTQVRE